MKEQKKGVFSWLKKKIRKKELGPVGTYMFQIVSVPEELDFPETLPLEIQYLLRKHSHLKDKIKKLLRVSFQGKALGVKTVMETSQKILDAVNDISTYSQHFTILTWLPELLKNKISPIFTEEEKKKAQGKGIYLEQAVQYILDHRFEFKKLVLVDEANEGISTEEKQLMEELNKEIYEISIDWIIHRMINDNAHERTEVAQTIIKSLLFVGPIAHFLEIYAKGIGKVFAASADDVLSEVAEIFALRGSGFSWKTLARRGIILIPVFIVATFLAFRVEHYIELDRYAFAGFLFGFSAVALSLTTAIQSIFLYFASIRKLIEEGKLQIESRWEQFILAFRQDFTNPARLGLGLGAVASPIAAMLLFSFIPQITHNGWVLALLGSTESLVAALTVFLSKIIHQKQFEHRLKKSLQ